MSIENLKFSEAEFAGKDVTSLPDNPSAEGVSASDLKARFDSVAKMMVALGKYNDLIDALGATSTDSGAKNIGAAAITDIEGGDVQTVLESLKALDDTNKAELLECIEQRIPKADIVQMRGRSQSQVMSQKAVTDAIDAGGGGGGGGEFEPVGCMKFFAGETLPDGYLWCDGQSYPTNGAYTKLFGIIGTAYNQAGDAADTFRVPDMRGRSPIGLDADDTDFNTLGKTYGNKTHTLKAAESGLPAHFHPNSTPTLSVAADGATGSDKGYLVQAWGNTKNSAAQNAVSAHNNVHPVLVCNYIIKFDRSYEQIGVTAPPVIWDITAADWEERSGGGYALFIPESEHRRGAQCVLTALYDTSETGKLKAVLFEMEKNEAGDITIYSDTAFPGKAYIDRVYMVPAGRVLSVNGQGPDMEGDVRIKRGSVIMVGISTQTIVNGTITPVIFSRIISNKDNLAYDTATGRITVPNGYRYARITGHSRIAQNTNGIRAIYLNCNHSGSGTNPTILTTHGFSPTTGGSQSGEISYLFDREMAPDVTELWMSVYQSAGSDLVLMDNTEFPLNYLNIEFFN